MSDFPLSNGTARGLSITALVLGVVSLASLIVFLSTSAGPFILFLGLALGLGALVFGIIALRKGQPKAAALIGLILGALVFLFGLAIVVFALLFVGAFTASLS